MQRVPGVIFINLNKYCFTRLYWAVRTCGGIYVIVICTFLFFFPSFFFLLWFHAAITAQSSITVANHSPAEIQPSGGQEQNSTGTKVNIKQDEDPELQVFLNQPELICHFNPNRGKMDPSTRTREQNCWYPSVHERKPHNGHWNNLKQAKETIYLKKRKSDIAF